FSQLIGQGRRLQQRACVGVAVLQVVVYRAVNLVGARLGHDVDDTAERAAIFRSKTVVHDAELLHGILRGRGALHTANRVDEIGAVHRDLIAERAHASEGDLRDLELSEGRSQTGSTGRDAGREQSEVSKQPAADRQICNL